MASMQCDYDPVEVTNAMSSQRVKMDNLANVSCYAAVQQPVMRAFEQLSFALISAALHCSAASQVDVTYAEC